MKVKRNGHKVKVKVRAGFRPSVTQARKMIDWLFPSKTKGKR